MGVSEQTPRQREIFIVSIMARWSSLFMLFVINLAKATTIDIDGLEEEDGEERTVFTSGGTYYIALNTTYLLYYSLLAGLALSGLFTGSAESTSGYGQQYGYQQKQGQGQGGFARNKICRGVHRPA